MIVHDMNSLGMKWGEMYVSFLKHCFLEMPPEVQAEFWDMIGNRLYARKHEYLSLYEKELAFQGDFFHKNFLRNCGIILKP